MSMDEKQKIFFGKDNTYLNDTFMSNHIYTRSQIEWYTKFSRFGTLDAFNAVGKSREYLFFTKPDLHIVKPNNSVLNDELSNQVFFNELRERYPNVIAQLQYHNGIGDKGPFMALLSNSVKNSLEIPTIEAATIDTAANIYGTSYNYRGWGYNSDEKISFSLEFEDTKYLEVYHLVKAYEEYERLKHLGLVSPPNINNDKENTAGKSFNYYIQNKILHDQFSIYKFIVEDDGETIIHYSKLWGVFFKNVPRDVFSDMKTEGGLTLAVEFEAAFIEDMNPTILMDFNSLVAPYIKNTSSFPLYNTRTKMVDGRWAKMPLISKVVVKNDSTWNGPTTMNHTYKLKWRI